MLRLQLVLVEQQKHCVTGQTVDRMSASADDAINIYKQLATFPSVTYGRVSMEDTPGHLQVYSEWTQRDLERSETLKFARSHVVQLDVVVPTLPHVIHDELWNKESQSGR